VVTGVIGFDTAGEIIGVDIATGRGVGVTGVVGVVNDDFDVPKRVAARIY
jgi:hypothetical protein